MGGKNSLVVCEGIHDRFVDAVAKRLRALVADNGLKAGDSEAIFGPVAAVIRVHDYDEALHVAYDTVFGLSVSICTTSMQHARHLQSNAQASLTMTNLPTAGLDYHVPFGGTWASSYGPREQGRYAVEFYTTSRTSYIVV